MFIELLGIMVIGAGLFVTWLLPNALALAATEYDEKYKRFIAHLIAHIPLCIVLGAVLESAGILWYQKAHIMERLYIGVRTKKDGNIVEIINQC